MCGDVAIEMDSLIRKVKHHIHGINEKTFENIAQRFFSFYRELRPMCYHPALSDEAYRSPNNENKGNQNLSFSLFLFFTVGEIVRIY